MPPLHSTARGGCPPPLRSPSHATITTVVVAASDDVTVAGRAYYTPQRDAVIGCNNICSRIKSIKSSSAWYAVRVLQDLYNSFILVLLQLCGRHYSHEKKKATRLNLLQSRSSDHHGHICITVHYETCLLDSTIYQLKYARLLTEMPCYIMCANVSVFSAANAPW